MCAPAHAHLSPMKSTPAASSTGHAPSTPPTVSKSGPTVHALEGDELKQTLRDQEAKIIALKQQASRMDIQMKQLMAQVNNIDLDNEPDAAKQVVAEMQQAFKTKRQSYTVATTDNAIACFLHSMRNKGQKESHEALIQLLQQWRHESADVALNFLRARVEVNKIVHDHFENKIVPTNPLDNMTSVILHHPNRLIEKWRVEFARWCDWSRNLNLDSGENAQKSFRWSPLCKKFWTSMRIHMSETAYKTMATGLGTDPDSGGKANIHAPDESTIRKSVAKKQQSHRAGMTSDECVEAYVNKAMEVLGPDACYAAQWDAFDLLTQKLGGGDLSGRGEAHMGDLKDCDDKEDRLQWAREVRKFLVLKDDEQDMLVRQLHYRAVYQVLQECMAKAREVTHHHATLLHKAKELQVKHAKKVFRNTARALDADVTWADLYKQKQEGAAHLQAHIEFTSSMAKHQGRIETLAKILSRGRQFMQDLSDVLQEDLSVAQDRTPLSLVEARFKALSVYEDAAQHAKPLFDVQKVMQRWRADVTRSASHAGAQNAVDMQMFENLPAWFCDCYSACMRVDAEQAISVIVQDVQRLLPPLYVSVVYVPKLGWNCDRQNDMNKKVMRRLHQLGITVKIEVSDGAFDAMRQGDPDKPMHLVALYDQALARAQALSREKCVQIVKTTLQREIKIHLHDHEIEQEIQGNDASPPPALQAKVRAVSMYETAHAGEPDAERIAKLARATLGARAAMLEGRSAHPAVLLCPSNASSQSFGTRIWQVVKDMKDYDTNLDGLGKTRCKNIARALFDSRESIKDKTHLLAVLKANHGELDITNDVCEALTKVIHVNPPDRNSLNKVKLLPSLRKEAAACLALDLHRSLVQQGIGFDEKRPADPADIKFVVVHECPFRGCPVQKGRCTTHLVTGLRSSIAHGGKHDASTVSRQRYECLMSVAEQNPSLLTPLEVDGNHEQSVPVAKRVLNTKVADALRAQAAGEPDVDTKASLEETAQFIHVSALYTRAVDETGITPADRSAMLRDIKRFWLAGIDDFSAIPAYVKGLVRGTWIQLLISIDNLLLSLDHQYCARVGVPWIHVRSYNQNLCETLHSLMDSHRTVELFHHRLVWARMELNNKLDSNLDYHLPISSRTSRVFDANDQSRNPHLSDNDAGRKRKRSFDLDRGLGDPHRRSDWGVRRNQCRLHNRIPECRLPHQRRLRAFDIHTATNSNGDPIWTTTSVGKYDDLARRVPPVSQAVLERALPQHLADGSTNPAWAQARSENPSDPQGPRPENASSIYMIFGLNRTTKKQQEVRMHYLQRKINQLPPMDDISQRMCEEGHRNEIKGVATGLKYLCEGTKNKGEQVGVIRLGGEFPWVAASLDVVLHVPRQGGGGTDQVPLEIKCPSTMFGRTFDGALKLHHLIQLHVQMCAVKSSYAYILYWTSEESHLYRVDFDQKLWDLIAEGLRAWRKAITSNAAQVPKSPEVKARKAQIEGRLADIYRMCLQNNDYTWLPSYVDRMP